MEMSQEIYLESLLKVEPLGKDVVSRDAPRPDWWAGSESAELPGEAAGARPAGKKFSREASQGEVKTGTRDNVDKDRENAVSNYQSKEGGFYSTIE